MAALVDLGGVGTEQVFLNALWAAIDVNNLKCCQCYSQIDLRCGLARTFCLRSQCVAEGQQCSYSAIIEVPTLDDQLIIYHRHMECLFQFTEYVAISHVWHRDVADAQYHKKKSTVQISDVARIIRDVPARVCQGVFQGLGKGVEIWHDYISVPQWQDEAKWAIIQAIPQIFERAMLTTAYLSDLDVASISAMREGSSSSERCRGISNICNAKWFSRVWTAMEFTQSDTIRFMTKDFVLVNKHLHSSPEHHDLFEEIKHKWSTELREAGIAIRIEAMVGMGYNLVPWQLGPLNLVRRHNKDGIRNSFAIAHELLSRRCVTCPRDFFHGLLGILKTGQTEKDLSEDMSEALLQVARRCLRNGDLSPLFMVPAAAQGLLNERKVRSYGYIDLDTFALGAEEGMLSDSKVLFNVTGEHPIVKAERIGMIQRIVRDYWHKNVKERFLILVRLTIEVTGVDVDSFVRTLGGRLYGQETRKIFDHLSKEGRRSLLESRLSILRDTLPDLNLTFGFVLGENPVLYVRKHRTESSSQYTVNLAEYLGNDDGKFSIGWDQFHLSARAIRLDGTTLTAQLKTRDGRWLTDRVDVRSFITYSSKETEEDLDLVADAMGLSNRVLDSRVTPLSPLEFLNSHGGTIHLGSQTAVVRVSCPACCQEFLIRTAFFSNESQVADLTAWRIPGLKYEFSLEGGAGFVLNNGRIVGRFLWASETCDCHKLEEVEVLLSDLPVPRGNQFEYGSSPNTGWIAVAQ
ncbi:hypothetical protein JMJ35_010665 [Cladonia borealis]|uniref:Heterokaryon incompatibility domain-containing protein n=1 Tax=Cladonia borealis TaxID=184061 RepID=A0AA39QPX7_9LECA|nr:hypothetical protein JMJ35_010665 [Cladonia borealis]